MSTFCFFILPCDKAVFVDTVIGIPVLLSNYPQSTLIDTCLDLRHWVESEIQLESADHELQYASCNVQS